MKLCSRHRVCRASRKSQRLLFQLLIEEVYQPAELELLTKASYHAMLP